METEKKAHLHCKTYCVKHILTVFNSLVQIWCLQERKNGVRKKKMSPDQNTKDRTRQLQCRTNN